MALYYYTNMCTNLLNYKNYYNQNIFIHLNNRYTNENIDRIKKDIKEYKNYQNKKLLENVIEFLNIHYIVLMAWKIIVNDILKKNDDFKLDTPKRYRGE